MAKGQRKYTTFKYGELKHLILNIPDPVDRFMVTACYLNGARISEIVLIRAGDIRFNKNFLYITTYVLKKRGTLIPQRAPPIDRLLEPTFTKIVIRYSKDKTGRLIPYSTWTARRRINKYLGCTTHSLRHTRATHCFIHFHYTLRKIAEYFKISPRALYDWSIRYGHLQTIDLEQHSKQLREELLKPKWRNDEK